MKHRVPASSSTPRAGQPRLRWLGRLRGDQRGASLSEQVLIMGVAVVGMVGFSRFGTEVHDDLDREAQHVRGRGSASAALSMGALAGSYQPQLPPLRRGAAGGKSSRGNVTRG